MTLQSHSWAYTWKETWSKSTMHPCVHCSTVYSNQDMEEAWMSINRGMDKEDVVCVCVCIYIYTHTLDDNSTMKKNKIMPFAAIWMRLEIVILSEVREGEIWHDLPHLWDLKRNDTNELTYKTETDLDNEFMVAGGKEKGKG